MSESHRSEVAAFRERQALEEEAMRLGMYGFAMTASHQTITARMQLGAERILSLINAGKDEEAQALMNTEYWRAEVETKTEKGEKEAIVSQVKEEAERNEIEEEKGDNK
jgi:hypothetical protein